MTGQEDRMGPRPKLGEC